MRLSEWYGTRQSLSDILSVVVPDDDGNAHFVFCECCIYAVIVMSYFGGVLYLSPDGEIRLQRDKALTKHDEHHL